MRLAGKRRDFSGASLGKSIMPAIHDTTMCKAVAVQVLDEAPVACANIACPKISGAEEAGVKFKTDAALRERAAVGLVRQVLCDGSGNPAC
jgi:hypothetical protein